MSLEYYLKYAKTFPKRKVTEMKVFPEETKVPEKSFILLKEKKKSGTYKNDCLNCLFYPMLHFSYLLHPLLGRCKHLNDNFSGNAVFRTNNIIRIISIIYLTLCLIGNLMYFRKFALETENYILFIAGLYNIIKTEVILITVIILLLKLPTRMGYLTRLSYIFENKKYYGINHMICEHCAKSIRKKTHFTICYTILILIIYPSIYYIQYGREAFKYINLIFFFTAAVQGSLVYGACTEFNILELIYRTVHISLTSHLEKLRHPGDSGMGTLSLEEKLRRVSHLYLEMRTCVQVILDFVGPIYALFTISIIFLIVLNTYVVFLILTSDSGGPLWLTQINSLGQIGILLNFIWYAQGASEQSKKTMDYLFNYPISILKAREAFQVELIIKALIVRNPKINIKNMLILDTAFLASIASILVTFSMVVIQLHMVLVKNDMNIPIDRNVSSFV